jgi:Na+/alanine symporter
VAGVVSVDTVVDTVVVCTTVVVTSLTANACEKPGVATNPMTNAVTATAKTAYATYRAALLLAGTLCLASALFSGTVAQPE